MNSLIIIVTLQKAKKLLIALKTIISALKSNKLIFDSKLFETIFSLLYLNVEYIIKKLTS